MSWVTRRVASAVIAAKENLIHDLQDQIRELQEALERPSSPDRKLILLADGGEPVVLKLGAFVVLSNGEEWWVKRFLGGDSILVEFPGGTECRRCVRQIVYVNDRERKPRRVKPVS